MAQSNNAIATASADELAATLARNSRPQAAKATAKPAETDHAEREQHKPVAQPKVADTPAPKATTPPVEGPLCRCGCGGRTKGGRFIPGHDARLHGRIKRQLEGRLDRSALTPTEVEAVDGAIAEGHVPGGSFAPQDSKSSETTEQGRNEKKAERVRARIARLELELAAAKGELKELGHTPDEAVTPSDHTELVQAMKAEGTA